MLQFNKTLKKLLTDRNISQAKLSALTGISKASISEYLSSSHEPTRERKKAIAAALGLQEDYFDEIIPEEDVSPDSGINLPVPMAARLMGKSVKWVQQGLQDGVFPWGYAVKLKKWSYFISTPKFTEYTGIEVKRG